MFVIVIVEADESYLESVQSSRRTTMTIGSKSNEHINADTVTIDYHLQPAE